MRSSVPKLALGAALLFPGCLPGEAVLLLPPFGPEHRSAIVTVESGLALQVFALPFDGAEAIRATADHDEPVAATALLYTADLAELGIPEGRLREQDDGLGGQIPSTAERYRCVIEGSDCAWARSDLVSERLREFRSPDLPAAEAPCARLLHTDAFSLPDVDVVEAVTWTRSGDVLVVGGFIASRGGQPLYRVSGGAPIRVDPSVPGWDTSIGPQRIVGIAEDQGAQVWLSTVDPLRPSSGSRLWAGSLEGGFAEVSRSATTSVVRTLLAPDSMPGRVYALGIEGELEWFDGRKLTGRTRLARDGSLPGSLVDLGGAEISAMVRTATGSFFLVDRDGHVVEESVESPAKMGFEMVVPTPMGPVALALPDKDSSFHLRDTDGRWRELDRKDRILRAGALTAFREGFLMTSRSGSLVEYRPEDGPCQESEGRASTLIGVVRGITPLGPLEDEVFLLTGRDFDLQVVEVER